MPYRTIDLGKVVGPQGEKGDTGPRGAQGEKGDTGAVPHIIIGTVKTLNAGETATVTRRLNDTDTNPIFDFAIPRGETGAAGAKGRDGVDGEPGAAGPRGATGATPDIQVGTVTNLAAGSKATVEREPSSPDEAPVFNFGIPVGLPGPAGGGGGDGAYYGTCDSAAGDSTKVVTLTDAAGFELKAGVCVNVKFTNANSSGPALNVEGTGSKLVMFYGTTQMQAYSWRAGEIVQFVYDGQYWQYLGGMAGVGILGKTLMAASNPSSAMLSGGSDEISVSTKLLSQTIGRKTGAQDADTNYDTVMMRGSKLVATSKTYTSPPSGAIAWVYE